jgi:hypothetical protein
MDTVRSLSLPFSYFDFNEATISEAISKIEELDETCTSFVSCASETIGVVGGVMVEGIKSEIAIWTRNFEERLPLNSTFGLFECVGREEDNGKTSIYVALS